MTTQDSVSLHLAKKLADCGYNKYAETQYVWSAKDNKYKKIHKDIEWCAMAELAEGAKILYAPSLDKAYEWLLKQDPNWNVAVLWHKEMKGFYFVVQNIETGYEYKQLPTPNELNVFKMYEWGIEHVINRLNE